MPCESVCLAIINPDFVLYQVDDLQDKYHECLEMLMENQVKLNAVQSLY